MTRKTIITIALVGLTVGAFMLWGRAGETPTYSQAAFTARAPLVNVKSSLTAAPSRHDFGAISMRKGNVAHVFRIANTSDRDVTIASVVTSCMCTTAYLVAGRSRLGPFGMPGHGLSSKAGTILRAGETTDVEVVYDPNAHGPAGVGPMERQVQLVEAGGGLLQLEIKGTVTP